ncbi:MAG: glycosyltransferase [Ilumatobacteraceae bacterium]
MTDPGPVRVLSIPAEHPYVRHTLGVVHDVVVLDDPTTPWWPPRSLDPVWVREHRATFDLVHVHFGFEQIPSEQLRRWCAVTTELGLPVVVTVHDLRNPHLHDNAAHEIRLEILLARADAVITLTSGAADDIRRRYGTQPFVLPHPHVVPLDAPLDCALAPTRARVGLYFGSGRANTVPPRSIVPLLATTCARLGATLQVSAHAHAELELIDQLLDLRQGHDYDLRIAPRASDDALFADVAAHHVVVLPYMFGSHSGWIELCRDLGTRVVAPRCGHYMEQWDEIEGYSLDNDRRPSAASLRSALERALRTPAPRPADRQWRTYQRDATAAAHRTIYTAALRRRAAIPATAAR